MKNVVSNIIVCLCFFYVPAHAAEILSNAWAYFFSETYEVGYIDELVLKKAVAEKGIGLLKKEIIEHDFMPDLAYESLPVRYIKTPEPYTLSYSCARAEQTPLSQAVFTKLDQIEHEVGFKWPKDKNKLNRDQPNRISLCTNWSLVEGKNWDEAVTVTTLFYDRKSLLAALNGL